MKIVKNSTENYWFYSLEKSLYITTRDAKAPRIDIFFCIATKKRSISSQFKTNRRSRPSLPAFMCRMRTLKVPDLHRECSQHIFQRFSLKIFRHSSAIFNIRPVENAVHRTKRMSKIMILCWNKRFSPAGTPITWQNFKFRLLWMKKIPYIGVGDISNCIILLEYPHLKSLNGGQKQVLGLIPTLNSQTFSTRAWCKNMCHDKRNRKTYTRDKFLS